MNVLTKKNPFRALKYGVQGVQLKSIEKRSQVFVPAFKKAIDSLSMAIEQKIENCSSNHSLLPKGFGLMQTQARWRYRQQQRELSGYESLKRKLSDMRKRLDKVGSENCSAITENDLYRMRRWSKNRSSVWNKFFQKPGFCKKSSDFKKDSPQKTIFTHQETEKQFFTHLKTAKIAWSGADTRLEVMSSKNAKNSLFSMIDSMDNDSRLKLLDGSTVGFSTHSVTAALSTLACHLMGRVRLDASYSYTPQATLEIGATSTDFEIVIGSQRKNNQRLGVGAAVGPQLGPFCSLTAGVEYRAYEQDKTTLSGICLQIPRPKDSADIAAQDACRERFKYLVEKLLDGRAAGQTSPEFLQELLSEFQQDGLSINVLKHAREKSIQRALSVDVSASIGVPLFKWAVSADATVTTQRRERTYDASSGARRIKKHFMVWFARQFGRARQFPDGWCLR